MLKGKIILSTAIFGFFLYGLPQAMSATLSADFYTPVENPSAQQAMVVYYRITTSVDPVGVAHLYVDREFHNSLRSGEFTTFCIAPGKHTLESYIKDAPYYVGKKNNKISFDVKGGSTYFLRVNEVGNGTPQLINRVAAENELAGAQRKVRFLSRASKVQKCDSQKTSPPKTSSR
ncbi:MULTISPECIES: DUF2846 domain-containing protein [unclassified Pseudomonas]|uniref:DUF2846 domain-containing protein n=1 Tax=unclassified Pseudomonas TaxID=196821 RepID=UPI001F584055|nr:MULTISPECIES: DUF2846 domain-containing protein [unclassified Pseudomonas]